MIQPDSLSWLNSGGEMGRLIGAKDWSKTVLGPIEHWPQSLKTSVSLCLKSLFPTVIYWGPEFATIYNDGYAPILGAKHPWALGVPVREVWAEIWEEHNGPMLNGVLSSGVPTWSEDKLLNLHRRGFLEETYFTYSFAPVVGESGKTGGIFCTCTETTERILAERRLVLLRAIGEAGSGARTAAEACRKVCEALLSATEDIKFSAVYLLDQESKQATLVGQSGEVPKEFSFSQVVSMDDSTSAWPLGNVAKTGKSKMIKMVPEVDRSSIDNTVHSALVLPLMIARQENQLYGFLVAGLSPRLDVGDKYASFLELVARQFVTAIASARAYEEECKRAEKLAELDHVKTKFFSNISHEFRTPLTLMLGPVEKILAEDHKSQSAEVRSQLELVYRNALRLLKLVNTLLDFSRVEANSTKAHFEPTDLSAETKQLASMFESVIENAGMKFSVDCSSLPSLVYVDRDMWEKIVLNLISNAFKFTLGGEIAVSLKSTADSIELKIRDTGVGIPPSEIKKIFQRFHRVEATQGRTNEGTGIGLALVKDLVELHKGTITCDSILGKGSVFTVTIPAEWTRLDRNKKLDERSHLGSNGAHARAFVEEASRWLPSRARIESNPDSSKRKKKILLADDNRDMLDYVHGLLTDRYDVTAVSNGGEALEAIAKDRPDLVISDIMMPVMSGSELLNKIRSDQALKAIPVILLSARAGEEAKASGIELGADDYLTKPFSAIELQARVQTQLNLFDMRTSLHRDLEVVNRELEAFSYSVSHDLRAPLRGILAFTQILKGDLQGKLDDGAMKSFNRIEKAAEKMAVIVDALLKLSRFSRGKLVTVDCNLSDIAAQIVGELRSTDTSRDVKTIIQPGVIARGDNAMLRIALENLVQNAWKYSKNVSPSVIEFGIETLNGQPVYYVKDNGAGFNMEYGGRLFKAFERIHSSEEFEGTGIGLATVHRIISRHGGSIWAHSEVGKGAQFYFTLESAQ